MLDTYAHYYYQIGRFMGEIKTNFPHDAVISLPIFGNVKRSLKENLIILLGHCQAISLHQTASHIQDMLGSDQYDYNSVRRMVLELENRLDKELSSVRFMHVPANKIVFYQHQHLFGPNVANNFPSAAFDIREAGTCFALGMPTACVFHLMRVLEKSLHALAGALNVPFPSAVELENWKTIIDKIESEIKKLEAQPKSVQKSADLQFYSEAAKEFRYFKDAWRNHVAHSRTTYDEGQAAKIMRHVADFMQHLATRLQEPP